LLAAFLVFLYTQVVEKSDANKDIQGFDPYEILELERGTTDPDLIKRNFR
jgi:hypothetical protein